MVFDFCYDSNCQHLNFLTTNTDNFAILGQQDVSINYGPYYRQFTR